MNKPIENPEETLDFKLIKPRETFFFNTPIQIKADWMIGLTESEVYKSFFNITEKNKKFEVHKFPNEKAGGVTYEKVRDEIEKDLNISDITATDLQDGIIGPNIIEEYREQVTKRLKDVGYMNFVAGYVSSVFQDFESYIRTEVGLVESDIKLFLDEYNSGFITYELEPGIYNFKDICKTLFSTLQIEYPGPSNAIVIEFDDFTRKLNWL